MLGLFHVENRSVFVKVLFLMVFYWLGFFFFHKRQISITFIVGNSHSIKVIKVNAIEECLSCFQMDKMERPQG